MGERVDDPGQISSDIEEEKTSEQRIEDIKRDLFDREMPEEYQPLVEGARFIEQSTVYSQNLYDILFDENSSDKRSEIGRYIADEIKDNVVLDLGCGKSYYMNMFANGSGASLYIGVDLEPSISIPVPKIVSDNGNRRAPSYLRKESYEKPHEYMRVPKAPEYSLEQNALQVTGDMLRTISRMKSHSIKLIIVSGIEMEPNTKRGDLTDQYVSALEKETKRVLTEDGLLLNYQSDISLPDLEKVDISSSLEGLDIRRNIETEVLEASEN